MERWLNPAIFRLTLKDLPEGKWKPRNALEKVCLDEIGRRCLTTNTVSNYLKMCEITGRRETKRGLAFRNDAGGHVIRIPLNEEFDREKFTYGPQAITFFRAHPDTKDVTAFAFPQFWDFLTYIHIYGKRKDCSYCVYNGLIPDYAEQLRKDPPKRVLLAHSNDEAGKMESVALGDELEPLGINWGSIEHDYAGYKDLSAWRMKHPYVQHNQNRIQYAPRPQPAPKIS